MSEQPTAMEVDGVSVPTELYQLSEEERGEEHQAKAIRMLPQAFESLASSSKVRLGLDHDEEQLFDTLLNTTLSYEGGEITHDDQDGSKPPETLQVRVAGGWVRDKILGLQTHDVDITVDKMTGVQFATLIQKYLLSLPLNHPARCQKKHPRVAVIGANPAQSKHLETATMRVHGIDIDVCHLRSEEIYDEHSRIPTVSIGTPHQDAQRRDFTLNSLFYNLKTKTVEDWTQRGIEDLRRQRLVTPLDAQTTFRDDPLRVLRAIRFAVRYRLDLDEGLEAACKCSKIHEALRVKVSRERVGKELEGMLSGKGANPQEALRTIGKLKLAGCVFVFPSMGEVMNKTEITQAPSGVVMGQEYKGDDLEQIREKGWDESQKLLDYMPRLYDLYNSFPNTATTLDKRLFPLALFLLPFRQLKYQAAKSNNRNNAKPFDVATFIFQESIKFKNKDVQGIECLVGNIDVMAKFLNDLSQQPQPSEEGALRLVAGLVLRETKELWVTTLLLACLVKLREQDLASSGTPVDWLKLTATAWKTILDLGLEECWKAKPLMNGKEVIKALDLPRGPIVSTYLEEQTRWMLQNPKGTKEECEQHLHSVKRQREAESGSGDSPAKQQPRLK